MESFALSFASMVLALAIVLGLAWVVLRFMRSRMQPRGPQGTTSDDMLRFVRALPVGAKERVVIVEHRGARYELRDARLAPRPLQRPGPFVRSLLFPPWLSSFTDFFG